MRRIMLKGTKQTMFISVSENESPFENTYRHVSVMVQKKNVI